MQDEGKQNAIDSLKQEETARKIAVIKAKKQEVINNVKLSLKQRQFDKIVIEKARSDRETSIRQKEIRDMKKLHEEKAMLQVII